MVLLDLFSAKEAAGLLAAYKQNQSYSLPPSIMNGGYQTQLQPLEEMAFKQWVSDNNVPVDSSPQGDYDMRGFYRAKMHDSPNAGTGMNSNDGRMHFTDYFKTPYHHSFSLESKFAAPGAPSWNELDQLVTPSAKIVFDERKQAKR